MSSAIISDDMVCPDDDDQQITFAADRVASQSLGWVGSVFNVDDSDDTFAA